MSIIDDLKSEVFALEERFLSGDEPERTTDPMQLTDGPPDSSDQKEPMRSSDLEGTVYRDDNVASIDVPTSDEAPESVPNEPEQREVTSAEELRLCLDILKEACLRAQEVVEGEDAKQILSANIMSEIDDVGAMVMGLVDTCEKLVYDYQDDDEDVDDFVGSQDDFSDQDSDESDQEVDEPNEASDGSAEDSDEEEEKEENGKDEESDENEDDKDEDEEENT